MTLSILFTIFTFHSPTLYLPFSSSLPSSQWKFIVEASVHLLITELVSSKRTAVPPDFSTSFLFVHSHFDNSGHTQSPLHKIHTTSSRQFSAWQASSRHLTTAIMDPPDFLAFLVSFAWTLLSSTNPALKNRAFSIVFSSFSAMQNVVQSSAFQFADGLWEVFHASVPPTIAFLKTLPMPNLKKKT